VSSRHKSSKNNAIINLPLIVEDIGLGLMLESIKREHLAREGGVRAQGRSVRTKKMDDNIHSFRSNELPGQLKSQIKG